MKRNTPTTFLRALWRRQVLPPRTGSHVVSSGPSVCSFRPDQAFIIAHVSLYPFLYCAPFSSFVTTAAHRPHHSLALRTITDPPYSGPDPDFSKTCDWYDIDFSSSNRPILRAKCKDNRGKKVFSQINLNNCLTNVNGKLKCAPGGFTGRSGRRDLAPGLEARHGPKQNKSKCTSCDVTGDDTIECSCPVNGGGRVDATYTLGEFLLLSLFLCFIGCIASVALRRVQDMMDKPWGGRCGWGQSPIQVELSYPTELSDLGVAYAGCTIEGLTLLRRLHLKHQRQAYLQGT